MKESWTYKKLGEVCEILDSERKPVTKADRISGIYPYYGATGIQDHVDKYIFDGDYLLVGEDGAKWGTSDKTAYQIHGKCWVNNHAHILKVNDDVANTSFLEYYLVWKDLRPFITGAIVQKLTQAALVSIPIPVPPLSTQSRIVAELDLLQSLIDKQKAQLKEYDTLAQSIFYDMFGDPVENEKGWEVKKLGEITVKYSDGPFGSNLKSEHYQQTGVRVIRLQNIGVNTFIDLDQAYISEDHYGTLSKYSCYPGDIVIGTLGEPNLRACLIPNTIQKAINKADCVLCRVRKDIISNTFLCMVLNEKGFVDTQCQSFSHGQTRTRISAGQLKKSLIPVPPLSLQQSFAQKIESIERQKELINQSIREARALFDSRMEYYFGE